MLWRGVRVRAHHDSAFQTDPTKVLDFNCITLPARGKYIDLSAPSQFGLFLNFRSWIYTGSLPLLCVRASLQREVKRNGIYSRSSSSSPAQSQRGQLREFNRMTQNRLAGCRLFLFIYKRSKLMQLLFELGWFDMYKASLYIPLGRFTIHWPIARHGGRPARRPSTQSDWLWIVLDSTGIFFFFSFFFSSSTYLRRKGFLFSLVTGLNHAV